MVISEELFSEAIEAFECPARRRRVAGAECAARWEEANGEEDEEGPIPPEEFGRADLFWCYTCPAGEDRSRVLGGLLGEREGRVIKVGQGWRRVLGFEEGGRVKLTRVEPDGAGGWRGLPGRPSFADLPSVLRARVAP